jgi:hypothetical protein
VVVTAAAPREGRLSLIGKCDYRAPHQRKLASFLCVGAEVPDR